jgi:uncharacterized protein DUF4280
MPGYLVHEGAEVNCAHGGQAQPTVPTQNVLVSNQPIVTMSSPYTVTGCSMPPPPAANGPCVTAQWLVAATRVTSYGQPVLLVDSQALCAPTGTPLLVASTQIRVKGM